MNIEPLATLGFAFVLLGESFSGVQMLGAAAVMVGVVLSQKRGAETS